MIGLLCSLGRKSLPLLAVLIVCLLPAASQAQSIKVNNATKAPLVIQVIYSNARGVQPQRPCTLKPGDTAPAFTPPPGVQVWVWIADAMQPNVILLKQGIPAANTDQYFEIVPGPGGRGPKVALQPATPPPPPKKEP